MANKSYSLEDLAALDLATGEVDQEKKKKTKEDRDRAFEQNEKEKKEKLVQSANKQKKGCKPTNNISNRESERKYVGAPYNFVRLWDKVSSLDPGAFVPHDCTDNDLISGEISYTITSKTPIIISDGKKKNECFVKNPYGQYAIPGSSVCGLIRSNVQILSQSSLADDIDDYMLMYREVGGDVETSMNKEIYNVTLGSDQKNVDGHRISVLKNVKAGYIENTGRGYKIYPTKLAKLSEETGKMNYYVLSERAVFKKIRDKNCTDFDYLKELKLQHYIKGYEFKRYDDNKGKRHYVSVPIGENDNRDHLNKEFKPGYWKISYKVSQNRVSAVGKEEAYDKKGYLLISGAMQEKKVLYIIPEIDRDQKAIEISNDDPDIKAFKIDYEHKKNQLKQPKSFWNLPQKGEIKPVFYIQLERLYFGFTPHLRIFYKETIHSGLGEEHNNTKFDVAKSLFGYSNENESYKSRLSFSDATVNGSVEADQTPHIITLGGPKPSSYSDYLSLSNNGKPYTYNDEEFKIRGVKQYWLRDEVINQTPDYYNADERKKGQMDRVASFLHPLPIGTSFNGKVRFHNLKREELGLLIWALRLDKECDLNIGKGKPYGYGRINLKINNVKKLDIDRAYRNMTLELDPFESLKEGDIDDMVGKGREMIANLLGLSNPEELDTIPAIDNLMKMKNATDLPEPSKIRYMDINKKEYQNRRPLNSVEDVLNKKPDQ